MRLAGVGVVGEEEVCRRHGWSNLSTGHTGRLPATGCQPTLIRPQAHQRQGLQHQMPGPTTQQELDFLFADGGAQAPRRAAAVSGGCCWRTAECYSAGVHSCGRKRGHCSCREQCILVEHGQELGHGSSRGAAQVQRGMLK